MKTACDFEGAMLALTQSSLSAAKDLNSYKMGIPPMLRIVRNDSTVGRVKFAKRTS